MAENQSGYELTNKLFALGAARGVNKNLLDNALPFMRALAEDVLQSCHLVVPSDDQVVVVGQMDAPGVPSFHMRVGLRQNIVESAAGAVLYAFQRPRVRDAWRGALEASVSEAEWEAFEDRAYQARAKNYLIVKSHYAESVIDIACPVFNERGLIAAITLSYIKNKLSVSPEGCAEALVQSARDLSNALGAVEQALEA